MRFLAAGVASFEDLIRLVDVRARAMEEAAPQEPGKAMSAVMMLGRDELEQVCREASVEGVCQIANYNCPGAAEPFLVLPLRSKRLASWRLPEAPARSFHLKFRGHFIRSGCRKPAIRLLLNLKRSASAMPESPVFCNVDAQPTVAAAELKRKLLDQITGSVRYEDIVNNMLTQGISEFVEVGPGKVLAGLNKKIAPAANTAFATDPQTLEQLLQVNQAS